MKKNRLKVLFVLILWIQFASAEGLPVQSPKVELVIETGHIHTINSVVFSPDGKILASGSNDSTIKLWDVSTGRLLKTLESGADTVSSISFAPDSKTFVTSSYNGTFILWEIETGLQKRTFKGAAYGINLAVFSPDGSLLAIVNKDAEIKLWSVERWEPIKTFAGHTSTVFSVAFSPDGKTLASGSFDQTIKFWSVENGTELKTIPKTNFTVQSVAFSPDGTKLVSTGNTDNKINFWDVGTGKPLTSIVNSDKLLTWAAFSPTEKKVISTDRAVKIWDSETGQLIKTLPSLAGSVSSAAFSPNGKLLASADEDLAIRVWDVATASVIKVFEKKARTVWTTVFSQDGKKIAVGNLDSTVDLWSTEGGKTLRTLSGHTGQINAVEFSPNGEILASGSDDKTIKLWDTKTGKFIRSLATGDGLVLSINFSTDGRTLRAFKNDGEGDEEILWNVSTGRRVNDDRTNPAEGFSNEGIEAELNKKDKTLSPNDKFQLVLGNSGKIDVYDTETNNLLISLIAMDKNDWVVSTPDGRFDTNKSLDRIEGLHWVVNNEILKPLPLELYLRQYFEPGLFQRLIKCLEGSSCDKEFKLLPSISEINRLQPKVAIKQIRPLPDAPDAVDVLIEVENVEGIHAGGRRLSSGAFDLRLFRDGQLVGVSTPKDNLAEFIKSGPRLAEETAASGKILNTPEDAAWRAANDVFASKSENLKIISAGKAEYVFRNVKLPKDGRSEVEFTAYAFNSDRVRSALAGPVRFPIPASVRNAPKKGRAIVLSIGVNASEISRFNLQYAANDARKMQEIIGSRAKADLSKYSEVHLIPLISDYDTKKEITENTAQKAVIKGVFSLLAGDVKSVPADILKVIPNREQIKPVEPEDTLIITYAGHGYADRNGIFYLLPFDVGADSKDLGAVLSRSISSDEISLWMQDVTAQEMIFIVDACNSAAAVEGSGFKPGPMGSRGLGQLAYDKGMRILAATQADNVALELNKLQQGLLSYALLQNAIIEKKADTEAEFDRLGAKEWLTYAVRRVPEIYQEVEAGKRTFSVDGKPATVEQSRQLVQKTQKTAVNLQQPTLFDFNRKPNQKYFLRLF